MKEYTFKTIDEIEKFLEEAESGELDNIWEISQMNMITMTKLRPVFMNSTKL